MSNLLYLVLAIVLSSIGTLVLVYRARKPKSLEQGIEEFHRELRALSPPEQRRSRADRGNRPG